MFFDSCARLGAIQERIGHHAGPVAPLAHPSALRDGPYPCKPPSGQKLTGNRSFGPRGGPPIAMKPRDCPSNFWPRTASLQDTRLDKISYGARGEPYAQSYHTDQPR